MTSKKPASAKKISLAKQHAQIEYISIVGIKERMGPLGLQLYSEAFLAAALALPAGPEPFEPVRPYLVCHALELGLKAYLSLTGLNMMELSDGAFGHKLESLLDKAEGAGLLALVPLNDEQRSAIKLAATYYAGKVFEYPAIGEALRGYPSMSPTPVLLDAAKLLTDSLAKPCREAK
jgi:hypothetical protein